MTIDKLPNLVLLEIFDFYMDEEKIQGWHVLVHVCQKWRIVVFGSPRRLNLRLRCTARTPVRETLDVWPMLPIVVEGDGHRKWGEDNILAALEHNDRICQLGLTDSKFSISQWGKVLAVMHQPFPALTRLLLQPLLDEIIPVDPDSFLGGSAPSLRTLSLHGIPFSGLPKLLLSATHLVDLDLWEIPHSAYISPEVMVNCLSVLPRLEKLDIGFNSRRSRPDPNNHRPPPPTRTLLPNLTDFSFRGVSNYLEDFVVQIEVPQLDKLYITLFHQQALNTPQLARLISTMSNLKAHDRARIVVDSRQDDWDTFLQTSDLKLTLGISGGQPDCQLGSLMQVCSSIPQALILAVENFYIFNTFNLLFGQVFIDHSEWLEIFPPFAAVKSLYISWEFTMGIAYALRSLVAESVMELLPALQNIYLEDPSVGESVQNAIDEFVAARRLASHPIAVSRWEME